MAVSWRPSIFGVRFTRLTLMGLRQGSSPYPTLDVVTGGGDCVQILGAGGQGSRFDVNGTFITSVAAAPADADLAPGELALWFNASSGVLEIKAKTSAGVVKTGSVTLA